MPHCAPLAMQPSTTPPKPSTKKKRSCHQPSSPQKSATSKIARKMLVANATPTIRLEHRHQQVADEVEPDEPRPVEPRHGAEMAHRLQVPLRPARALAQQPPEPRAAPAGRRVVRASASSAPAGLEQA